MPRLRFLFLLGLAAACSAQPSGQGQYDFSPTRPPALWDLSGTYSNEAGGLRFVTTLHHSPSGLLTGTGLAHYSDAATVINATQTLTGHVSGSSKTRVTLQAQGQGQFTGTAFFFPVSGPFMSVLDLSLNPANSTVSGRSSGSLCIEGRGCRTLTTNVTFQLPPEVDGAWTLALNVTNRQNAVRGTATAQLSNGHTVAFNVRGTHAARSGISRLKLLGTGAALRSTLTLRLGVTNELQALNGKLFGQRLVFP